MNFKQQLFK